ncbi:MAG: hypothetical protein E7167_02785 [Firmicutes bacterium]|nr:hypothetical protein [Bacillota bacterium]
MKDIWNDRSWSPMLLGEIDKPFDSDEYFYEVKFDGIRTIAFVSPSSVKLYSRRNIEITFLYPELQKLCKLVKRNTIFDGEIVLMENGVPSFSALQKRVHLKRKDKINYQASINPVVFVCFDLLYDNEDLTNYSLSERKKVLNNFDDSDVFIKTKYIEREGVHLFKNVKHLNLEGIVAKKKDSIYEISTRTDNWLKIKNLQEGNFYIGGYVDKPENFVISVLLGEYINKKLNYVGKATLGKKTSLYKKIKKQKELLKNPFVNFDNNKVTYIKPEQTCKVKYLERTLNNQLRQPVIKNK